MLLQSLKYKRICSTGRTDTNVSLLWDSANIGHVAKHNVSPEEAEQVITNNPIDLEIQFRNGEERIAHLGETAAGRVLVVIVTMREELIRVVTAHPANRAMRKFYAVQKDKQDAQNPQDT